MIQTLVEGLLNASPGWVRDGALRSLMPSPAGSTGAAPEDGAPRTPMWPSNPIAPPRAPRRVVVIGAGIGGAAIAALLARHGHRVTVLEAREGVGGRGAGGSCGGFRFDWGVHLCNQGPTGPLARVADRVGAELAWRNEELAFEIRCGDRRRVFRRDVRDLGELAALARVAGVAPAATVEAARTLGALMFAGGVEDVAGLDGVTVSRYLARYTDDPGVTQLAEAICLLMLCVPADVASAGEFVYCFSNLARAGGVSYPVGGIEAVAASFVRAMGRQGGILHTGACVREIAVVRGRVVGVETRDTFHPADWVVSNAGIKNTLAMVGADRLPRDYVARIHALEESFSGVTIKYGLAQPLLPVQALVDYDPGPRISRCLAGSAPRCPLTFLVAPTDPDCAPPGQQLVVAGALLPRAALEGGGERRALDALHRRVCRIIPDLEERMILRLETGAESIARISGRASADVVGIGQRYDQVGVRRPDVTTPVDGLYLVGCDAGGRGVGVEQAADSALNLATRLGACTELASRSAA